MEDEISGIVDKIVGCTVSYEGTFEYVEKERRIKGIGRDIGYEVTRDGKGKSSLDMVFPAIIFDNSGIFRGFTDVEIRIRLCDMTDPSVITWGDA